MSQTAERSHLTYADYLALEAQAEVRHEYLRGEVFAMAGGTPEHAALGAALTIQLGAALRGKPCRIYSAHLRIRAADTDFACYPDVAVVCDKLERAADDEHAAINPVLLVEVLSDSTEAHDRGDKAAHYRRIPSLQAYLLVSQTSPRLELYSRKASGRWELSEARAGETLEVDALEVSLSVDDVYADPLADA